MNSRILIVNGSLGGATGNTAAALAPLAKHLEASCEVSWLHLAENKPIAEIEAAIDAAHGFVFATGTYWDSWGSPLQAFFESTTHLESTASWLGKPAAVVVTMHSVGGKAVLSRLQGVLSSQGLLIPPMSGMVYSLANQLALQADAHADLWQLEDLEIISKNLLTAIDAAQKAAPRWQAWPVDREDPKRRWL